MTLLSQLSKGDRASITAVEGEDSLSVRLLEMGLTPGIEVVMLGSAPLGDPLEFQVRGYRLSLRKSEAARVLVDPIVATG